METQNIVMELLVLEIYKSLLESEFTEQNIKIFRINVFIYFLSLMLT